MFSSFFDLNHTFWQPVGKFENCYALIFFSHVREKKLID